MHNLTKERFEAMVIKAADMLIARRADTRARADFATWKMMAKLNGASALPPEAQNILASYRKLLVYQSGIRAAAGTMKTSHDRSAKCWNRGRDPCCSRLSLPAVPPTACISATHC